jgi:hypothetical protein
MPCIVVSAESLFLGCCPTVLDWRKFLHSAQSGVDARLSLAVHAASVDG